ncbi:histidine kinase [Bradyrhizobium sp. LLZ17]|uniref:Histidine kinase n=1 Tax=Bradyrhizobium sp. LLZ17 TaxID=3239388 RepID=A0AB39XH51_9BRAD
MIKVLVVEDDTTKYGKIHNVLTQTGVKSGDIFHAVTAANAMVEMGAHHFDLMLLDVNIPRRLGESVHRGGGVELLDELHRDGTIFRPRYIVGLTAFEDVVAEFGDKFTDLLWTLIYYADNSDHWISQVTSRIEYVRAAKNSENFSDGKTYGVDLAVVCALEGVEFEALRGLDFGWQPLRLSHDETRYLAGTLSSGARIHSVVAAAAPRMGMASSAVLVSKVIAQFRPRILAMVGICAGRIEKTNLGDIIVADPTWDWGSGKISSVNDQPHFQPSPHHIELDTDICAQLKDCCSDVGLLARIKKEARGAKPSNDLRVHFGPLASGAAVVANADTFISVLAQHRNLLGIEMEAYGVALACKGSGKPRPRCLIIKSVCDYADKDKADDHQEYAANTSALLLYHTASHLLREQH